MTKEETIWDQHRKQMNPIYMTMKSSLDERMGQSEIGEINGTLTSSVEPKPLICKFCKKELPFIGSEYGFWIPPKRCGCDDAKKYWAEYDSEIEKIEAEIERLEQEEIKKAQIDRLLDKSNLGRRFADRTFDNYRVEPSNKSIYQKCMEYAKNFKENYKQGKGLLFIGTVGTGKTHLAASISNYIIKEHIIPVKFGNVTSLLSEIKASWDENTKETEAELIRQLSQIELLVIDDLGKEKQSEWSNSIIYTIINNRYENYKPIIVTTNLDMKELEKTIGEAAVSRLIEMCEGIKMNGTDYRKTKLFKD